MIASNAEWSLHTGIASAASKGMSGKTGNGGMIDAQFSAEVRRSWRPSRWQAPPILAPMILAALITVWASCADAQINPFRGYNGPTLSKEDLATGQAAAQKLLTEDEAQVGRSEQWMGKTSGNAGNISVQRAFKRQGMDCRALRMDIHYKDKPGAPRTFNLNVCRLQTGEWKIV
jgi:hypothetical protein